MGKPNQAPPLAGSEWIRVSPGRMIPIPLIGLNGPVSVKGQEWNLAMPPIGASVSDEDLAAVLSYIRQNWGNNASEITPEQVQKVRAQMGNRTQPLTAIELNSVQ
jgi:mono/diheme cytochrome c family protein